MPSRLTSKNIRIGDVVYHSIFVTWGKGIVRDTHTSIFDPRKRFLIIGFEFRDEPVRFDSVRGLRRTPNRKKILDMIELYKWRGVECVDGGDVLIIPDESKAKGGDACLT